jgi:hypothetical protein
MMVDLEDDAEWSTKDTIDDEEDDRFEHLLALKFQNLNFV